MGHKQLTVAVVLLLSAGIQCVVGAGSRQLLATRPEYCKAVNLNYGAQLKLSAGWCHGGGWKG
jgi:hypothetical protein